MKMKITKDILIADLIEKYPKSADILVNKYQFHCVGCLAAGMETLEQGAEVHGMNKVKIKSMIEDLNKILVLEKSKKK